MEGLMDEDGENQAVRYFLMLYGSPRGYTAGTMACHMRDMGFDVVPKWADDKPEASLTKEGAQLWLRMLFDLEKPPFAKELEKLREDNVWHNFRQAVSTIKAASEQKWHWFANPQCKYIGLRIDMRDLGCIIMDRDGNRITPEQLEFQHQ